MKRQGWKRGRGKGEEEKKGGEEGKEKKRKNERQDTVNQEPEETD